MPKNMYVIF